MLSETDAEKLHADVLKVGHHGSKNSTMPEFLEIVGPEIAVISAGEQNPYGHPSPELLERLRGSGAGDYGWEWDSGELFCGVWTERGGEERDNAGALSSQMGRREEKGAQRKIAVLKIRSQATWRRQITTRASSRKKKPRAAWYS